MVFFFADILYDHLSLNKIKNAEDKSFTYR
jgi:hypothetical protein